jgi:hypothetical protein
VKTRPFFFPRRVPDMTKLTKPLFGVPQGEIYPRWLDAGDECPENLLPAAREAGALGENKAAKKTPERK